MPPGRPDDGGEPDNGLDVQALFAEIVAQYDKGDADTERPDGASSGGTEKPATNPAPHVPRPPTQDARPPAAPPTWRAPTGPGVLDDGDTEHFVPPTPPRLPHGSPALWAAWAGAALGPLFLVFTALFWRTVPRIYIAIAIAAFVAGFIALVLRLPWRHDPDDDDDDGARV